MNQDWQVIADRIIGIQLKLFINQDLEGMTTIPKQETNCKHPVSNPSLTRHVSI